MKFSKYAVAAVLTLGMVGGALAVDDATTLITTCQTTITTLVGAVLIAGGVILLSMLGLKALPFAYRKITAFFR